MFLNPIIPGFAPDPSVVLVEGVFYLVTSSFHLFPGIPIYASIDLHEWTHIGNAINRTDQIDLRNATTESMPLDDGNVMVASGGLFAPTIRYRNGIFYIVCTNCYHGKDNWKTDNFIIRTNNIWANKWSNPVQFPFYGIDPSLFFDDDDRAYIQGSWMMDRMKQPSCTIKQVEIDIETGTLLSAPKEIWGGFAKRDTEGPHIYKKDGWYYLLVAEGGTFEHHMLSIARSRNIWGPYESCPQNPIMTADGTSEYIQNVGHGEIFQDTNDDWWAAILGVRDEKGSQPMGRETFLTPVEWPKDSWPNVQQPRMSFSTSRPPQKQYDQVAFSKKLSSVDRSVGDLYLHQPLPNPYITPSKLVLCPTSSLSSPEAPLALITRRQRSIASTSTTTLQLPSNPIEHPIIAGLTVYKDPLRHASICVSLSSRIVSVNFTDASSNFSHQTYHPDPIPSGCNAIEIRITSNAERYEFSFRTQGSKWTTLGKLKTKVMTARDFTGTVIGVFAVHGGHREASEHEVIFDGFEVLAKQKSGTHL